MIMTGHHKSSILPKMSHAVVLALLVAVAASIAPARIHPEATADNLKTWLVQGGLASVVR